MTRRLSALLAIVICSFQVLSCGDDKSTNPNGGDPPLEGSIVAWGGTESGQCNVPAPNSNFVAMAAGWNHGLGLKADGSIVAWGDNTYGQCTVPEPNTGFVAVASEAWHSLGFKTISH